VLETVSVVVPGDPSIVIIDQLTQYDA
jgi:hypothetical protein